MKKTRRILTMILVFLIALGNISFAEPMKVIINNNRLLLPTDPVSIDGRTLVPLRAIFEAMGLSVEWEQETKTIIGKQENKIIKLQVDNKVANVDGQKVILDTAATTIDGNTLIPVRFVAEALGAKVEWDNNTKSVLINSDYPYGNYKVVRVVDGDTIIVDFNGVEERVRFIGVDTPESVHPDLTKNVTEGKIASEFTKDNLEGKEVALEFDVQERDHYGRLLAYVWYSGEMFNKVLLREGYAQIATYPPNVKYVDDFIEIQKQAREDGKGLWEKNSFNGEVILEDVVISKLSVNAGEDATLIMKGTPGEKYIISVYYKSGKSKADGLEPKIADENGNLIWTWKVGNRTSPGTYKIVVSGDKTYNYELIVH